MRGQNLFRRLLLTAVVLLAAAVGAATQARAQFTQQGPKLVGSGAIGNAQQGRSVAISADGNTAIVGGRKDNGSIGAAWVYTRSGGVWTQHGSKLVGNDIVGNAEYGESVALSADGNTAIVGGSRDNGQRGAAWVFTRNGGVWTQQGSKLIGDDGNFGMSAALSADGNTAVVGGIGNSGNGAAWVFTRSGSSWSQTSKLIGSGAVGSAFQGVAVALSSDGNTAIVGGPNDTGNIGAAWVFTRSGGVWTQQGGKLVGSDVAGNAEQGSSVALSGDGNTVMVGGPNDSGSKGAVWIFTVSGGVWTQQGSKLVGIPSPDGNPQQGKAVALSADGDTALVGQPSGSVGAAVILTRSGGVWTQQDSRLVGSGVVGQALQGSSVALSSDGNTAALGGYVDNFFAGAAWVFVQPHSLKVTPTPNGTVSGNPGGPFFPSSVDYFLSTNNGSIDFSISGIPTWLAASATSGTLTTSPTTLTFTINANANSLQPGTYNATITFTNTTNGQGNQSRSVTLTVAAGATSIVAAVAPNARTTKVGTAVTGFATIINAGTVAATACSIALPAAFPANFLYQTTDPATNLPTGTPNAPAVIAAGSAQTFYFAITPSTTFSQDIALVFQCSNTPNPAPSVAGLNTFLLTVSSTPIPDMLSIADTFTHDANVVINGMSGLGVMVAASIDIGAAGTIVFTPADTPVGQSPRNLPLSLSICQTNSSGQCINPTLPGTSSTVTVANNQTVFFSIFAVGQGVKVPYDPANNRIFILAKQAGTPVGEASAAVKMQ